MATYTQKDRAFKIETVLGPDKLLLEGFSGQERISQPFQYVAELVSQDKAVDPLDLLRTPVTLSLKLPDGSYRPFHGLINRFVQLEYADELTGYEAEVVPWLWFLSLTADCRIFQQKSVLEIVEEIFSKYSEADFQIKCVGTYGPRNYCVQYRETDLNFISRLLEEEGIFYFFVHSESGHKLVLVDDTSMIQSCPARSTFQVAATPEATLQEGVITDLRREHVVNPSRVTLRDYDFLQPANTLHATQGSDKQGELYDYPGEYVDLDLGERYANLHLQEQTAGHEAVRGAGSCRTMATGFKFQLEEYYIAAANQHYLIVGMWHAARGGGYRSGKSASIYSNQFQCIPANTLYRPPRLTPRPFVQGSQTALVVGPSGEEIHTDKHGRVKVQFYWDRLGKKDEKSSCWIRVSQPWAGKGWGSVAIPRIGQEVIVEFLEGDPDLPIITGRVYNADQVPPYPLPANQTQSGVKSRSTKGGGTEDFNEIRFEDKKGSEEVYIHAQKDKREVVENDNEEEIGRNESIDVGKDQTINIAKNRTETVGANETITVEKDRTESVGGNESVTVSKNRTHNITKNDALEVGVDRNTSVGKKDTTSVGDDRTTSIGKNDKLDVGKKLVITAGDEISITTGDAAITLKKNGEIKIKGKNIVVEGSGKITIKASSDLVLKGSKIAAN